MRSPVRYGRGVVLFLALAGCAALGRHGAGPKAAPWFFIQMSDPQFGMISRNKDTAKESELFGRAIDQANRLKPAFVVITGDLTSASTPDQIAAFQSVAGRLDPRIPLHLVAGNHDLKAGPDQKSKPTPEALALYRKNHGKDWYSFAHEGRLFIALDSCLIKDPEASPKDTQAQWEWLKETLEANAGSRPAVVFQHHPWLLKDPDEPEQFFNLPVQERRRYLDLMGKHGVVAVFAGHWHRNSEGQYGEVSVATTGAVCNPLASAPEEKCLPGFRIVKVYPDRIEHRYYGLDEASQAEGWLGALLYENLLASGDAAAGF